MTNVSDVAPYPLVYNDKYYGENQGYNQGKQKCYAHDWFRIFWADDKRYYSCSTQRTHYADRFVGKDASLVLGESTNELREVNVIRCYEY